MAVVPVNTACRNGFKPGFISSVAAGLTTVLAEPCPCINKQVEEVTEVLSGEYCSIVSVR